MVVKGDIHFFQKIKTATHCHLKNVLKSRKTIRAS